MRGRAETRSVAETIQRLVAAVPGVIALEADLTWALDDSHIEAHSRDLVYPSTR
jgi:hypothetical protein